MMVDGPGLVPVWLEGVEVIVEFLYSLYEFFDEEILSDIVWECSQLPGWPIPDEDCVFLGVVFEKLELVVIMLH